MTEQTERAPLEPVERMTAAQIDELAHALVTGHAYIAVAGGEEWTSSFNGIFTLMLGGLASQGHTETEVDAWCDSIGGAWEYLSKAGRVSINGRPTFLSMRLIHVDDLPLLGDAWQAKEQALAATRPEAGR